MITLLTNTQPLAGPPSTFPQHQPQGWNHSGTTWESNQIPHSPMAQPAQLPYGWGLGPPIPDFRTALPSPEVVVHTPSGAVGSNVQVNASPVHWILRNPTKVPY
jgi:hypothetical protein